MKLLKATSGVLLGLGLLAGAAWADPPGHVHPRVTWGIQLGFPLYPYPYPYPYWPYSYPPSSTVIVQQPAPVYVERGEALEAGYWYYCSEAQGYYPQVKECPGQWIKVPPRPPEAER